MRKIRSTGGGPPTLVIITPCLVMPTGGSKDVERCVHAAQSAGWRVCAITGAGDDGQPDQPFATDPERISIPGLFRFGGPRRMLLPLVELRLIRLLRRIADRGPMVILVESDRPRRLYTRLQSEFPLLFSVRDNTLTCPAGTRHLPLSSAICTSQCSWSCLRTDRREGCLSHYGLLGKIRRIARRRTEMSKLARLDHILVNSAYTAFAHARSDARVVPPPIDEPCMGEISRVPRSLLFVGRLHRIKGVEDAIEVCERLGAGWTLDIIGSGPERGAVLERIGSRGLNGRVRLHGWLTQQETMRRMAASSILLVPSRWDEAFGRVGVEAFSVGTPVIAYAVGGIPEWCVEPAGRCVPVGNTAAMHAAAISLDDPELWNQSSNAARQAWQTFSVRQFRKRFLGLLDEMSCSDSHSAGPQADPSLDCAEYQSRVPLNPEKGRPSSHDSCRSAGDME